ncbi:MAG: hypothetical protein CM1200mP28_04490 [Deltaproteobacteria bacterium]|nr:MAG: hypothetical protein CM1200mP28_04490 [Deltaproteobacteria bacterium]
MGRIFAHVALSRFGLEYEPILRNPKPGNPAGPILFGEALPILRVRCSGGFGVEKGDQGCRN